MITAIPREKVLKFRNAFWNAYVKFVGQTGEHESIPREMFSKAAAIMAVLYAEGSNLMSADKVEAYVLKYLVAEKALVEEAKK